jgi:hypothetical protein
VFKDVFEGRTTRATVLDRLALPPRAVRASDQYCAPDLDSVEPVLERCRLSGQVSSLATPAGRVVISSSAEPAADENGAAGVQVDVQTSA